MITLSLISMHIPSFFGHHSHHHHPHDQTHTPAAFNDDKKAERKAEIAFRTCINAIKNVKKDGKSALNATQQKVLEDFKNKTVSGCGNKPDFIKCYKVSLKPYQNTLTKFPVCESFKSSVGDSCALLASCMTFPLERRELFQNFL